MNQDTIMIRSIRKYSTLIIILFLSIATTGAEEKFDPAKVRPKGCGDASYNCGFAFMSEEQAESIPLAASSYVAHRGIPSSVDLADQMPPVGYQGQQGSCVAWSSTYVIRSYYAKKNRGWHYDPPWNGGTGEHVFTPAYTYNQINGGKDNGSFFSDAFNLIVKQGALPWKFMPYKESDYLTRPTNAMHNIAIKYRAQGYERLEGTNLTAIKTELASGNPLLFGIPVDDEFYNLKNDEIYYKQNGKSFGGHAMVLIGYDDSRSIPDGSRGAFKVQNSWGTQWGENGYGWISYRMWARLRPYALVLNVTGAPSDSSDKPDQNSIQEDSDGETLDAPRNVEASRGSYNDRVVVSWKDVRGAIVYAVMRSTGKSSEFQFLAYTSQTSHTDMSVQSGASYHYIVLAVNEHGHSDPEKSLPAEGYASKNAVGVPGKVVGVSLQTAGSGKSVKVEISWNPVSGVSLYQVAHWNPLKEKWDMLGTTTGTYYSHNRPLPDRKNYYSVQAKNSNGGGQFSDTAGIQVSSGASVPSVVKNVNASRGKFKDKIVVNWRKSPSASNYYIYRYDYDEKKWEGPNKTAKNLFVDNDNKIRNGDWFAYTVVAANKSGYSDYSESVPGRTNPLKTRAGLSTPPPEVTHTIDPGSRIIKLQWKTVPGASEYYVFRKTNHDDDFTYIKSIPGNTFFAEDKIPESEDPETFYFYTIRSKTELGGESDNSNIIPAFINEEMPTIVHRFDPSMGLKNFVGTWKGSYYTKNGPVHVTANISQTGADFQMNVKSDDAYQKNYSGSYAFESRFLNAPGMELEIIDSLGEDIAELTVEKSDATKFRVTLEKNK